MQDEVGDIDQYLLGHWKSGLLLKKESKGMVQLVKVLWLKLCFWG